VQNGIALGVVLLGALVLDGVGLLLPGQKVGAGAFGGGLVGAAVQQHIELGGIKVHFIAVGVGVGGGLARRPGGVVGVLPCQDGVVGQKGQAAAGGFDAHCLGHHLPVFVPGRAVGRRAGVLGKVHQAARRDQRQDQREGEQQIENVLLPKQVFHAGPAPFVKVSQRALQASRFSQVRSCQKPRRASCSPASRS